MYGVESGQHLNNRHGVASQSEIAASIARMDVPDDVVQLLEELARLLELYTDRVNRMIALTSIGEDETLRGTVSIIWPTTPEKRMRRRYSTTSRPVRVTMWTIPTRPSPPERAQSRG